MTDTPAILLVEDNESDVFFIDWALKKTGITHSLEIVHDGEQAIHYLAGDGEYSDRVAHPLPRVVLLDLSLPGKSGFDVLEWITRHAGPASYAVVVLSSSNRPEDVVRAQELGARSFLVKPDALDDLVEMLEPLAEYLSPFPLRAPSFEKRCEPTGT